MISTNSALSLLLELTSEQNKETVAIEHSSNRVLANNIIASHNQPPFESSAMDGYAINLKDKVEGRILKVIGETAAGQNFDDLVQLGEAVRIFTGAPLPHGTNCIVIQEDVLIKNDTIILNKLMEKSHFVRKKASDFSIGYTIEAPIRIKPSIVSLIAAMNYDKILVFCKPTVAIIATGSELVSPGKKMPPNKIVSSNSYGLAAMLESFGAAPQIFPIVNDNINEIKRSIEIANNFDLILTTGGASVGDYDLVLEAAKAQKMKLAFHGVAMKPGKPLLAGTINNKIIIGLPGNPVSALVCCHIMIKPVIEKMLGLELLNKGSNLSVKLGAKLSRNGKREHYLRAKLKQEHGSYIVYPALRQDSSLLTELSESNCLIKRIPLAPSVDAGQTIDIHSFFPEID